jgi:hypothetical protein
MPPAGSATVGLFNHFLVAVLVVIAMLAYSTTLDPGGTVIAAVGSTRYISLAGGAKAMGVGTWSMHYAGMLAFTIRVFVFCNAPTVLVSLIAAVLSSAVAPFFASWRKITGIQNLGASPIMCSGIHGDLHTYRNHATAREPPLSDRASDFVRAHGRLHFLCYSLAHTFCSKTYEWCQFAQSSRVVL